MYPVEQAIRIALLEQTGLHEVAIASVIEAVRGLVHASIDMVLHCPACHVQHIDEPDERSTNWDNPPHRSHLCHSCGHVWRPADVATNGVTAIRTKGAADSTPPTGEPCAWIIEKVGHPVSMTHYRTVADSKRACGFTVTDHHSRVMK